MKLTLKEKYQFCDQMAMILDSGFGIQQGVDMIYQEIENQNLKKALAIILDDLHDNPQLSQAIQKTEMFDDYMVHLVKVGEVSGHIDNVMQSLSQYYARMDDMVSRLQQALTFPIILLLMMFVVVGVVVFQVLPIFQNVLKSLGSDLSSFANRFMQFGQIFSMIGFLLLGLIIIIIIVFYIYARIHHVNAMTLFVQKSWFTKRLANAMDHAQMTYVLSLFISSGYDFPEAVHYASQLVENKTLQMNLEQCSQDLQHGDAFVDVVAQNHVYQGMKLNMLQVGFKTGRVDTVMKTLSTQYQDEVNDSIERFLNIIEPTIVTFLSVIVGVVLLSVMLPLVSIMSSL